MGEGPPDPVLHVVHQHRGGHRAQGEHRHVLPHGGPVVKGALGVHKVYGQLLPSPLHHEGLGVDVEAAGVPRHAAPPGEAGPAGGGAHHLVEQEGLAGPHGPGHRHHARRQLRHLVVGGPG